MATILANCPRCSAQNMTFDVIGDVFRFFRYSWQHHFEIFAACRHCHKPTIFHISQTSLMDSRLTDDQIKSLLRKEHSLCAYAGSLNDGFTVDGFVSLKDHNSRTPPDHLPENIDKIFRDGVACQAIQCFNAAGTMYRLCLDLATRSLLPPADDDAAIQPSKYQRYNLKARLDWLFERHLLPSGLRDLSDCVREDGNDGAHTGNLSQDSAEDLVEFCSSLLERLYTEPEKLRLQKERRERRRAVKQ